MALAVRSRTSIAGRTNVGWSPLTLFAANEQGVWYDPGDFSTLFQDAAGTTPVTAVEQPVGLLLDKSKALALGSELISNGTFDTGTTGWTASNASLAATASELVVTNSGVNYGTAYQTVTTVAGKTYKVTARGYAGTATTVYFAAKNALISNPDLAVASTTSKSAVSLSFVFTATGTSTLILVVNSNESGATGYADNISVRELPGNHATQSTGTSRPVVSARVNLATKTEDFSDTTYWAFSSNYTVDTNTITAPDGTLTADTLRANTSFSITSGIRLSLKQVGKSATAIRYAVVYHFKKKDLRYCGIAIGDGVSNGTAYTFDLDNNCAYAAGPINDGAGFASPTYLVESLGSGWYRITLTATSNMGTLVDCAAFFSKTATYSSSSYVSGEGGYLWGADLRPSNAGVGLPSYQRVNTNTDYDTVGFPFYLKFDGVDDGLQIGAISWGSQQQIGIFTGYRKSLDQSYPVLVENFGNSSYRSFVLHPSQNTGVTGAGAYVVGGSSIQIGGVSPNLAAPATLVCSASYDAAKTTFASGAVGIRLNGVAQSLTDVSTGSYVAGNFSSTNPVNIGRRVDGGTASLWWTGNLYSLIIRGALSDANQSANAEAFVNSRTKAY